MKSIEDFLFENEENESKIGKKFDNVFKKNQNNLKIIKKK